MNDLERAFQHNLMIEMSSLSDTTDKNSRAKDKAKRVSSIRVKQVWLTYEMTMTQQLEIGSHSVHPDLLFLSSDRRRGDPGSMKTQPNGASEHYRCVVVFSGCNTTRDPVDEKCLFQVVPDDQAKCRAEFVSKMILATWYV